MEPLSAAIGCDYTPGGLGADLPPQSAGPTSRLAHEEALLMARTHARASRCSESQRRALGCRSRIGSDAAALSELRGAECSLPARARQDDRSGQDGRRPHTRAEAIVRFVSPSNGGWLSTGGQPWQPRLAAFPGLPSEALGRSCFRGGRSDRLLCRARACRCVGARASDSVGASGDGLAACAFSDGSDSQHERDRARRDPQCDYASCDYECDYASRNHERDHPGRDRPGHGAHKDHSDHRLRHDGRPDTGCELSDAGRSEVARLSNGAPTKDRLERGYLPERRRTRSGGARKSHGTSEPRNGVPWEVPGSLPGRFRVSLEWRSPARPR